MRMLTYFVVQSYSAGRKGAIIADLPVQASTRDHALRIASRLALSKQAVVAFSRTGDPKAGDWDPAVILVTHGHLPEEVEEEFAAA